VIKLTCVLKTKGSKIRHTIWGWQKKNFWMCAVRNHLRFGHGFSRRTNRAVIKIDLCFEDQRFKIWHTKWVTQKEEFLNLCPSGITCVPSMDFQGEQTGQGSNWLVFWRSKIQDLAHKMGHTEGRISESVPSGNTCVPGMDFQGEQTGQGSNWLVFLRSKIQDLAHKMGYTEGRMSESGKESLAWIWNQRETTGRWFEEL
jgi:hypothetical protein